MEPLRDRHSIPSKFGVSRAWLRALGCPTTRLRNWTCGAVLAFGIAAGAEGALGSAGAAPTGSGAGFPGAGFPGAGFPGAGSAAWETTRAAARFDPKDGPDVDLRIAVEDDEVRFQIITNLAFLDETCDVPREILGELHPAEASAAFEELVALFRARNEVKIDGTVVAPLPPSLQRDFEYDPGDPSLVPHFVKFGARAVSKTRLTLRFPCKSAPKRVSVTWGVFPPNETLRLDAGGAPPIEILCRYAAGGVDRVVKFTADEPQFIWHRAAEEGRARFAEVPVVARHDRMPLPLPWPWLLGACASLAGLFFGPPRLRRTVFGPAFVVLGAAAAVAISARSAPLPTEAEALAIFEPLHENIYRAFDYTDESDVYDALAQSVDGELLAGLYDEVYRSLVLQEEGGAVSRVAAVRHVDLSVETIGLVGADRQPGFALVALWQVDGAVYHWGHAHSRTNEYKARYTVHAGESGWRIAASEVLEQRRVDAAPLGDIEVGSDGWRPFGDETSPGDAPTADDVKNDREF